MSASEKYLKITNKPIGLFYFFFLFVCKSMSVCMDERTTSHCICCCVCVCVCMSFDGRGCRTLHGTLCFVCPSFIRLSAFALPSVCMSLQVCLCTSFPLWYIMNVVVFIVCLCESYLRQKNPQPAPLSLSVWIIPSLLHSVYENSQLRAQTGPATGF